MAVEKDFPNAGLQPLAWQSKPERILKCSRGLKVPPACWIAMVVR